MADAAAKLERRVMAAVKTSAARGDPPLLQAAKAASCGRGASSLGSFAVAPALVMNLGFAVFTHNTGTGAVWKLLEQAMVSRLVSPLHMVVLLTPKCGRKLRHRRRAGSDGSEAGSTDHSAGPPLLPTVSPPQRRRGRIPRWRVVNGSPSSLVSSSPSSEAARRRMDGSVEQLQAQR